MINNSKNESDKSSSSLVSKSGLDSWIAQRVTALALVPLSLYFAFIVINIAIFPEIETVSSYFDSPIVAMFMAIFMMVAIYHGQLGVKEVIEDYVHCHKLKLIMILLVKLVSFISAIVAACSILTLHLSIFSFS